MWSRLCGVGIANGGTQRVAHLEKMLWKVSPPQMIFVVMEKGKSDMAEYISRNELLRVINSNVAEAHNERCAQLLEAILNAPTTDVVPKSEVAREIIADFDEELHKLAERYYEQGKIDYFTLCEVIYNLVIAKIKKKYTEPDAE
jgi:hypothetical protein